MRSTRRNVPSGPRRYILALDQGTTSSRALVVDRGGVVIGTGQRELPQRFPSPGHVAHDPEAIWETQLASAREAIARSGVDPTEIAAIGIANQRETTVLWERTTSRPVADAIVWQSRITADRCARLRGEGLEPLVRGRTGLPIDPYFSATKIAHLLDSAPGLRVRATRGELCAGTIDSFLTWRLTGGRVHATDFSNASRTLLLDLERLEWDGELLGIFDVPRAVLPTLVPTSGVVGIADPAWLGAPIPIAALAGDQQAATVGQACFAPGDAKVTYGTGAFLLRNVGMTPVRSSHGLLSTVGWQIDGLTTYCLEGSVFSAGSAVQWLRDGLHAIGSAAEVEPLAASVPDAGGVIIVPAFVGLGAPHWDPDARGTILGLTRGSGIAHIARATLEAIAHQVRDVVDAMTTEAGAPTGVLRADGGAAANDLLLGLQADLLGVPVERPVVLETTAMGATYLAGIAVGLWSDIGETARLRQVDRRFEPAMSADERDRLHRHWLRAVERSRGWASEDGTSA